MISNLMQQAQMCGTTGVVATAGMPSYLHVTSEPSLRPAAWRAGSAVAAAAVATHVPAPLTKRDADFIPSGNPGGGPPI